jgi:hypothetical protein
LPEWIARRSRLDRVDKAGSVGGLCNAESMRARDDDGVELNAEFSVEADGPHLSMVLESAGGRSAGDGRSRNDQYVPALRLLLRRLRDRRAVLRSALVVSARISTLPESERTLVHGPLDLAAVTDVEWLRLKITSAQGRVGLPAGAAKEGNNRKRLQLRLDVPGFGPSDAGRLAADLAAPPIQEPRLWLTADELLHSLIGEEIRTVTGQPNMVLAVNGDTALVRTSQSPAGQPVGVVEVQKGLDKLRADGSVLVSVAELGYRSAFVGAVLGTLPGAQFAKNPATVTFREPISSGAARDPAFGVLDSYASVKVRREQAQLRYLLAGNRELATCALCGHEFPMRFLVAAHVKKRSVCTDEERRDLHHVAMLACSFGCDALYESGSITVDENGRIQTIPLDSVPAGRAREHLRRLAGLRCTAYNDASEPYFAWHRMTIYQGSSAVG